MNVRKQDDIPCMIVCYMLISSLCLRASETATSEKRESKNDKKAE